MNFDIEWNLQEFREEQKELFDNENKRITGVSLSNRTAEIMLKLIDDMENEIKRLEENKQQVLAAGLVIKSGNFKLKKKIETLNEFWEVINSSKSLYARHRMYPSAFFFRWHIKEVNKWLQRGWFWIAEPCNKNKYLKNNTGGTPGFQACGDEGLPLSEKQEAQPISSAVGG